MPCFSKDMFVTLCLINSFTCEHTSFRGLIVSANNNFQNLRTEGSGAIYSKTISQCKILGQRRQKLKIIFRIEVFISGVCVCTCVCIGAKEIASLM